MSRQDLEQTLGQHGAFVRNVARSLVFDEQGAEDVAQETWLAALQHPPERSAGIRAWLATVTRNFSFRMRRGEIRRAAREQKAARPEASAGPGADPAQGLMLREVIDSVLALSEPYRSTMLMRFYENLEPAEIAERLGIPAATVRTRLKRALDQLRARFDANHGGSRGAWTAMLAPIAIGALKPVAVAAAAATTFSGSGLTLGGILMAKKLALVGGLAAIAIVSVVVATRWSADSADPGQPPRAPIEIADAVPAPGATPATKAPATPGIAPKPYVPGDDDRAPAAPPLAAKGTPHATVVGRVVDQRGAPQPNVPVSLQVVQTLEEDNPGRTDVWNERTLEARTGPDGRFSFDNVQVSVEGRVRARPEILCDVSRTASISKPGVVDLGDLVALPGGSITGVVVGPQGTPVKGCKVHAWPSDGSPNAAFGMVRIHNMVDSETRSAVTNASGQYRIDGLPEGECALAVSSDDHPAESRSGIRVRKNEVTYEVDFKLTPGATLAGIVRGSDGEPIAGVDVTATQTELKLDDPERPMMKGKSTTTGADGRFAFDGLRQESFSVRARKPGLVSASQRNAVPGTEVVLVLKPSGFAFGHVRNAVTNAPVAGFSMKVTNDDLFARGPMRARVLRGAEAAKATGLDESPDLFAIVDLPDTPVRLLVHADEFADAEVGGLRAVPGDKTEVNVHLPPQAIVRGFVSNQAGSPVAGARVTASNAKPEKGQAGGGGMVFKARRRVVARNGAAAADEAPEIARSAVTESDGAFVIKSLPGGDYRLTATHSAFAEAAPVDVTVKQGGVADGIKLVVELGGTFAGRAIDADGNPLAGVRVQLRPKSARNPILSTGPSSSGGREPTISSATGTFEIAGLKAGEYLASLADTEGAGTVAMVRFGDEEEQTEDVPVTIEAGKTTHKDLQQTPRASLTGVVKEAGKPAAGVKVSLAPKGVPALFGQSSVKTDEHGAFIIDKVAPGDYTVLVDPPGAGLAIKKPVSLAPRSEQRIAIDLPTGAIEGRVTERASGKPLAGVKVSVAPDKPQPEETAMQAVVIAASVAGGGEGIQTISFGGAADPMVTDSDGRFRLRYLEPGKYRVSVRGAGVTPQSRRDVAVEEGRTTKDIDFGVDQGSTLLVTVDPAGHDVTLVIAFLQLEGTEGSPDTQTGNTKNPLKFAGLKPGRYHVRVDAPMSELEGEGDVDVSAGQEARSTIRLAQKQ